MRYKVMMCPYFYVEAEDFKDAERQAVQHRISSQDTVRPPRGILVDNEPETQLVDFFIFNIKEEPEDDGQDEAQGAPS